MMNQCVLTNIAILWHLTVLYTYIADNVGDNVGDVAGMGADLFGSFAESTCAALVIAAQTPGLSNAGWGAVCYPLVVSSAGILVCLVTSFLATHIMPVITENRIELALRLQLIVTTLLMIPTTYYVTTFIIPAEFTIIGVSAIIAAKQLDVFLCVIAGTIGGLIIGKSSFFTLMMIDDDDEWHALIILILLMGIVVMMMILIVMMIMIMMMIIIMTMIMMMMMMILLYRPHDRVQHFQRVCPRERASGILQDWSRY